MYLSFDRHPQPARHASASTADATGTPFTSRTTSDGARPSTERTDYRQQADGAP